MLAQSLAALSALSLLATPASAAYTLTKAYEGASFVSCLLLLERSAGERRRSRFGTALAGEGVGRVWQVEEFG